LIIIYYYYYYYYYYYAIGRQIQIGVLNKKNDNRITNKIVHKKRNNMNKD